MGVWSPAASHMIVGGGKFLEQSFQEGMALVQESYQSTPQGGLLTLIFDVQVHKKVCMKSVPLLSLIAYL